MGCSWMMKTVRDPTDKSLWDVDFNPKRRRIAKDRTCTYCSAPLYRFPATKLIDGTEKVWFDHQTEKEREVCDYMISLTKGAIP